MKKSEFIKMLKKEQEGLKNFNLYTGILSTIFVVYVIFILYVQSLEIVPNLIVLLIHIIHLVLMTPAIVYDLKNDIQIVKLYKHYKKEGKLLDYKDYSQKIKILLILEIIFILISGTIVSGKYLVRYFAGENSNKVVDKEKTLKLEFTTNGGNTIKMSKEEFAGFSIYIPAEFGIMNDEYLKVKYPSENRPTIAYTNDDASINIVLNLDDHELANADVEKYVKVLEDTLNNFVEELELKFSVLNGHKIGELEFISSAVDTKIYNHMIVFSLNGKLRLISFNCIEEYKDEWQDVSDYIVKSLKIN